MTDNEIIKALECCSKSGGYCEECPFYGVKEDCDVELPEEALDLINRQQAEIERKSKLLGEAVDNFAKMKEAMKRKRKYEIRFAETEVIKEFEERLCNGRVSNDPVVIAVKVELERMKELPIADVAEVGRGKWDSNGEFHQCSVCTNFASYAYDYCPYCGAEMTEVEE